ncbi:hypothetical protein BDW74DRAFT_183944 [Aspergillus multicolor]|uniref:uncharacterized protein n=1 Tax=Aspergillus multicolor TaxID=41759 RepID=UPI003CCCE157
MPAATKPLWLSLIRQLSETTSTLTSTTNAVTVPAGARSEVDVGDKWSLFIAQEGEPGRLYSLTLNPADAARGHVYVYKAPTSSTSLPNPGSTWSMYSMRTVDAKEASIVHEVVARQPIPTGSLQPISESAQGGRAFGTFVSASQLWVEGIVRELVKVGVLEHQVLRDVRSMMGPSRLAHFKRLNQE